MLVIATGVAFFINTQLAMVFLVALPVLGILLFLIISHVRPLYTKMQGAIDLVNRIIQENLTAILVVKAYVRGDYEVGKFEQVNQNLKVQSEKAFRLSAMNMPAMQFVMYGTILSILWFGGNMIQTGNMEIGKLTGFLSYVLQILNSLMMISNVFMMLTRSLASGTRIMEIIDEKIDLTDDLAKDRKVVRGDIAFDHVYFKYKKDAPEYVLSDISFRVKSGQTVGIVGQTGSAKSTLIQLIPRLYDVTQGSVLILTVLRCVIIPWNISGMPLQWCFRKIHCFQAQSGIICAGAMKMPRMRRLKVPVGLPVPTNLLTGLKTAMIPNWGRAVSMFPVVRNSGCVLPELY